ncbi:MAG: RNA polymerase sigma factor [Bacteroidota bacterium]
MNPDPKLLKACKRGDRRAQEQLYRMCFPALMGICMRYFRNESEAITALNESFLKILNNYHKRSTSTPFLAWIRRIAINTAIDKFRQEKSYKTHIQAGYEYGLDEQKEAAFQINEAELRLDAEAIEKMIQELPPMSKQVFNLFAIDGYSHQEIGDLLGISAGTSKWHVSFARKELKQKLIREGLIIQKADML